ncbi:MAG: SDR family oxidoreductase [Bdellovibrionales bacterium]|nr:SDR family oxidoreductase [Bdellovibrionales bacterium]
MSNVKRWLITGASGAIGLQVIKRMFKDNFANIEVVASDVRPLPRFLIHEKLSFLKLDIRSPEAKHLVSEGGFYGIIHLASIVSPGKHSNREFEYSVDVLGTKNILEAAEAGEVKQIIVTSSGAAYGYHKDLPEWITEDEPVKGNEVFAYSWHKKCVEDMLLEYRDKLPGLKQLIIRPGTILGDMMKNQITDLFEKPVVIGVHGSDSPFVFIWDQDVAEIIYQGMLNQKTGIFNLAGDGKVTNIELAKILKKPLVKIPAPVLRGALGILKKFNLTQYGPDQIDFLKYRPVLDNQRLKSVFGYTPVYTSIQVLQRYLNPQRTFLVKNKEQKIQLTPLEVFIHHDRLDDLIWETDLAEKKQQDELLDWISFFEGQRAGQIHLVEKNSKMASHTSTYVNVRSTGEADNLKKQLEGQKGYHSL